MLRDPIVEEIRRAREKIATECGYDLHKLLLRQYDALKRWRGKVADPEGLLKENEPTRSASSYRGSAVVAWSRSIPAGSPL